MNFLNSNENLLEAKKLFEIKTKAPYEHRRPGLVREF
jgi:hypothetical protein